MPEPEIFPPRKPRPQAPHRPVVTFAFMRSHAAHWVALGFGSGLSPIAPGTAGTLWAWLTFALLNPYMSELAWLITLGLGLIIGWWACTLTARDLHTDDPGSIVWDEIIAFWLILFFIMPTNFWGQLGAFILFRLFDAIKIGPVGWADKAFKGGGWRGGFGIIWDDLIAAVCTLVVIALWRSL